MKKIGLIFLFGITICSAFLAQTAYAVPACSDDKAYKDDKVGPGGCIRKHGGYYAPENKCADGDGCVYAFTRVDSSICYGNGSGSGVPDPLKEVIGKIVPPAAISEIGVGAGGINNFLSRTIELIYIIASIIFVFMVVISAVQWIASGGDKESVSKARDRLTHAIIGITLLALAFFILRVLGQITGFEFFAGQNQIQGCGL